LEHAFPGISFFRQGGDALANSKASFRAFAAAANVPIPDGTVCRTQQELGDAVTQILVVADGVMVKQSHNGAAAGCTVISRVLEPAARTAGSIWIDDLGELDDSIGNLWQWASASDRFPVIVETLRIGFKTIWFEFESKNSGVELRATGGLEYEDGKMVREHIPLNGSFDPHTLDAAEQAARRLAEVYHAIGYRGYLCADGLMNNHGEYEFTEMNARVGSSLPIHGGVWDHVVKRHGSIDRHITQHLSSPHWPNLSTTQLLGKLSTADLLYNHEARTGALLGIPPNHEIPGGSFLLILVTETDKGQGDLLARVAAAIN